MGAGKTTVMAEVSDLLAQRAIAHAAIDLDALAIVHGASRSAGDVMIDNLTSIGANYAAAGIDRLVLAGAVESRDDLRRIAAAVRGDALVVCRLTASLDTMRARVRVREPGVLQAMFVDRVEALDVILDRAHLEDFAVVNENRSVTDTAGEILRTSGWTTP